MMNPSVGESLVFLVHLNLLLDLFQESLPSVLAQQEVVTKFLHDLFWVVILEHLYLLSVVANQLNLQDAYWFFDHRQLGWGLVSGSR